MKKLLTTILILFCLNAEAATYIFRVDGGTKLECTGLVDAPKKLNRQCAWSVAVIPIVVNSKASDTFKFSGNGEFVMTVQPKLEYNKKTDFSVYKNHISFYADQMDLGKTFFFRRYVKGKGNGIYKVQYVGRE